MAYTQTFGFSRTSSVVGGNALSPLNKFSNEVIEEEKEIVPEEKKEIKPEVDTSPDADKDIIKANNEAAAWDHDLNEEEKRIVTGEGRGYDKKNIGLTAAGLGPIYGGVFDFGNTVLGGIRTATNFIGDTARGVRGEGWDYSRTKARAKETGWAGVGIIPATQGLTGGRLTKNLLGQNKTFKLTKATKTYNQTVGLENKEESTGIIGAGKGPLPDSMGSTISAFSNFGTLDSSLALLRSAPAQKISPSAPITTTLISLCCFAYARA